MDSSNNSLVSININNINSSNIINSYKFNLIDIFDVKTNNCNNFNTIDYNKNLNCLASVCGNILILTDLLTDERKFVLYHDIPIMCIKYSSCYNYLITIDCELDYLSSNTVNFKIWNANNLEVIYEDALPSLANRINNLSDKLYNKDNSKVNLRNYVKLIFLNNNISSTNSKELMQLNNKNIKNKLYFIVIIMLEDSFNYYNNLLYLYEYSVNNNTCNLILEKNVESEGEITGLINVNLSLLINNKLNYINNNNNNNYRSNSLKFKFLSIDNYHIKLWKVNINNQCSDNSIISNNNKDINNNNNNNNTSINSISINLNIQTKSLILPDSLTTCEILKLIIVISENCSLIFDYTGKFIVSLSYEYYKDNKYSINDNFIKEGFVYQNIFDNEKLFIGTNAGSLLVYNLNNFKLIKTYKYNLNIKYEKLLNNINYNNNNNYYSIQDINVNGTYIKYICFNLIKDIISIHYSDNCYIVSSINKVLGDIYKDCNNKNNNNYNHSIVSDNYYYKLLHMNSINNVFWLHNYTYKTSFNNNNDNMYNTFITTSTDQTIMIWKYKGDKWINYYYDLLKDVDSKLNYCSNITENKVFITAINVNNNLGNIIITGDNKNCIKIYEINENDNYYLNNFNNNKPLINLIRNNNLRIENNKNEFIIFIEVSHLGNYLSVGYTYGNIYLLDYLTCQLCCKICDSNSNSYNNNWNLNTTIYRSCNVFAYFLPSNDTNDNCYNANYSCFNNIKAITTNSSRITKPNLLNNNFLRLICSKNNNTISLQTIIKVKNKYISSVMKDINFEYTIKKVYMHKGTKYIIVLLDNNTISINRIETGQVAGLINNYKLNNNYFIDDIKLDASGLYIFALSFIINNNTKEEYNKTHISNTGNTNYRYKDKNCYSKYNMNVNNFNDNLYTRNTNTLLIFEYGTGKLVSSIENIFKINNFDISRNGKYISLCSYKGDVSIWECPNLIKDNVSNILNELMINNNFWNSFIVNYENELDDEQIIYNNYNNNNLLSKNMIYNKANDNNIVFDNINNESNINEVYNNKFYRSNKNYKTINKLHDDNINNKNNVLDNIKKNNINERVSNNNKHYNNDYENNFKNTDKFKHANNIDKKINYYLVENDANTINNKNNYISNVLSVLRKDSFTKDMNKNNIKDVSQLKENSVNNACNDLTYANKNKNNNINNNNNNNHHHDKNINNIINTSNSSKTISNFNAIDLQPEYIKEIINRKNFLINNKENYNNKIINNMSNSLKNSKALNLSPDLIAKDPDDIDDISNNSIANKILNRNKEIVKINTVKKQFNNSIYSNINTENNSKSNIDNNYNNVSDQIDFVYDNIYKFNKNNKLDS